MTRFSRNAVVDHREGRVVDAAREVDAGDDRRRVRPASRSTRRRTGQRDATVLVIGPLHPRGRFGYDIKMARTATGSPDADDELVARIPRIVDLDAHVVEPPDTWSSRLPGRFRRRGSAGRAPPGRHAEAQRHGATSRSPAPKGPDVAWWRFEDQLISVKRTHRRGRLPGRRGRAQVGVLRRHAPRVLAAGGPPGRHGPQRRRGPALLPEPTRGSAASSSSWAKDRELGLACVEAYNDWMVDEWCGVERRPAAPAVASSRCGTPSSPPSTSAATRRAACGPSPSASCRPTSTCRASTPATGTRSSTPARRPARSIAHAHRVGHQDAQGVARRARRRARPRSSSATASPAWSTYLFSGVLHRYPEPQGALRRGADRLDPVRARAGRRRVGDPPGLEQLAAALPGAAVDLLLPPGLRAASSRTRSASRCSTRSARTTSSSRPTTRTRTAPGPTAARPRPSSSATSTASHRQDRPGQRHPAARPGHHAMNEPVNQ